MDELMDMMVDDASASQISDKLKDILETMYHSDRINRTGNYRYYV